MLKITITFFLLSFIFLTSQVQINDKDCLKISTESDTLFYRYPNRFVIENNTNNNYIININGFLGSSIIYENNERLFPYKPEFYSNPMDWNMEECRKNILLIPKHEKQKSILNINIIKGFYKLDNGQNYIIEFESTHTKSSPYYFGCKKYVDRLVSKGYKIYEGTLQGKIKLIPKK